MAFLDSDVWVGIVPGLIILAVGGLPVLVGRLRRPLYIAREREQWPEWVQQALPPGLQVAWIVSRHIRRYEADGYTVAGIGRLRREVRTREVTPGDAEYFVMVVKH
jgi:hypothetical protein